MELDAGAPFPTTSGLRCPICIRCSYNLRGLFVTGNCPECGLSISESLRGDLLRYAGSDYVKTVMQGYSWIINALGMVILAWLAWLPLTLMASAMSRVPPDNMFGGLAFDLYFGIGIALPFTLSLLGYGKLTAPDPQFNGHDRPDAARKVVCSCTNILLVIVGLGAAVAFLPLPFGGITTNTILDLLLLIGVVAVAMQVIGTMTHARWLARRIPDARLVRRAALYRWLLPLLIVGGFLAVELPNMLGAISGIFLPLAAFMLYWSLLVQTRKHLRSIITHGRPAMLEAAGG